MQTFDFDRVYPRQESDSIKWKQFPPDVLPLWVADMDFASPVEIIEAMQERLAHPLFGYAEEDQVLRELICEWVGKKHEWAITPEQILFTCGVVSGMNWVTQSLIQHCEGVAFQTPVYPPFFKVPRNAGCPFVQIPLVAGQHGYEIDFDRFRQDLSADIRLFILCNPHNPVGRVFSRYELETIGEICLQKDILICSDEIHCDLVYSANQHVPIASLSSELAQRTVTLMAPSKTFNVPGLNMSFALVPNKDLRERLSKARRGIIGSPNLLANAAARAAYRHGEPWLRALLVYLERNRDYLMGYLQERVPAIRLFQPQGTYLAWLDCRQLDLDQDPCEFFLNHAKVALNNGRDFGKVGEGFVRLNFGCPRSVLDEALQRMEKAVRSL